MVFSALVLTSISPNRVLSRAIFPKRVIIIWRIRPSMKTRFTGQSYVILSTARRAQPPSLTPCQARRANVLAGGVWETSEMLPAN